MSTSGRELTSQPDTTVPGPDSPYWKFYRQVAVAQLAAWLPVEPALVLDLSGSPDFAPQLVAAGHDVVSVRADRVRPDFAGPGRLLPVVADPRSSLWVRESSVDLVLAECGALSQCLAAEVTVEGLRRVLRPGGRLLLVVESLAHGLSRLAVQGRWAELADMPRSDVALVEEPDGTISRYFWPEELTGLLVDAALEVEWLRPRSVLSPVTVERAVERGGPGALRALVRSELELAVEHEGQSGLHLVVSARRPVG